MTLPPRRKRHLSVITTQVSGSGVRLNGQRLRREMARRGINGAELAVEAGISTATMSAAVSGRAVAPRTLRKIAIALARTPIVPGSDELLETA